MTAQFQKGIKFALSAFVVFSLFLAFSTTVYAATLDTANERIIGLNANMQYRAAGGVLWLPVNGTTLDIVVGTAAQTFEFRNAPTAAVPNPPVLTTVQVQPRPAAPAAAAIPAVNFIDGENLTIPANMQVRFSATAGAAAAAATTTSQWISNAGTINVSDFLLATVQTGAIQVRLAPTATHFGSAPANVVLPLRPAAPAATVGAWVAGAAPNPTNGTITGIAAAHEWSFDGIEWTQGIGTMNRSHFGYIGGTMLVRTRATATAPASLTRTLEVPRGIIPPPVVGLAVGNVQVDFVNEMLINVTEEMQFRRANVAAWSNVPAGATSVPISTLIPAATAAGPIIIEVRYAPRTGANARDASVSADVMVSRRPPTPLAANHRFNGLTMTIPATAPTATVAGHEFRTSTADPFAPATGNIVVPMEPNAAIVHNIRVNAIASTLTVPGSFASLPLNITVPARAAAPRAVYNIITDMITGVSTAMEFSTDAGATWSQVPTTSIARTLIGVGGGDVHIRTRATATARPSQVIVVPVIALDTAAPTGITLDFERELIEGVTTAMEFRRAGAAAWTAVTPAQAVDGEVNFANLIPAAGAANTSIEVRFRASTVQGANRPVSSALVLPLNARPATPVAAQHRIDGIANQLPAAMFHQYRLSAADDWEDATGYLDLGPAGLDLSDAAYTVSLRVAPNAGTNTPASLPLNVAIARQANPPAPTYAAATDLVSRVTAAMEFSVNGDDWFPIGGTTLGRNTADSGDPLNGFPIAATNGLQIRVAATATARPSRAASIDIPAGIAAPTAPEINFEDEMLTGVATTMQFRRVGIGNPTAWVTVSGTTHTIANLIPAANAASDAQIEIRIAAAGGNPPSVSQFIALPRRPAVPVAASAVFNRLTDVVTHPAYATLQFRSPATAGDWEDFPTAGIEVDEFNAATTLNFRVAATATHPASLAVNFAVPARAAAPRAVRNATNGNVTGVTSAMEFRFGGTGTWTRVGIGVNTLPYTLMTDELLEIRVAATAATRASNITRINIPAAWVGLFQPLDAVLILPPLPPVEDEIVEAPAEDSDEDNVVEEEPAADADEPNDEPAYDSDESNEADEPVADDNGYVGDDEVVSNEPDADYTVDSDEVVADENLSDEPAAEESAPEEPSSEEPAAEADDAA